MMRKVLAIIFVFLVLSILACNLPSSEANVDATVNARVAATLSAVVGENDVTPGAESTSEQSTSEPTHAPVSDGSGPTLGNCPMFPADHILNTRVDSLPVDPHSDAYIESIGADTSLHPDFGAGEWEGGPIGIPYNIVESKVEPASISFEYSDESDEGPYTIPPDPQMEGAPDSDGDRHILIVDSANCVLQEIFAAQPQSDGSWEAGSGAVWDLTGYVLRPEEWTSADAAGLPILPLLVRYDEVAAGEIRHAIRFTAEDTQEAYVWPARHHASDITDTDVPPMGQRFRLKADFDISSYSHDVQVILRAMQQYGLVLADNGSNWYITGAPDPNWDNEDIHDTFDAIHGSDFEAVDVSSLMIDSDSGQAHQP